MVFFPLVVVYCQRYVKSTGIGTLASLMMPFSIAMLIGWQLVPLLAHETPEEQLTQLLYFGAHQATNRDVDLSGEVISKYRLTHLFSALTALNLLAIG